MLPGPAWAKKRDKAVSEQGVSVKTLGAQEETEVIKSASVCGVLTEVTPVISHISFLSIYVTVTLMSEFTL